MRYTSSKQFCLTYKIDQNSWGNCLIVPEEALQKGGYLKYVNLYQECHKLTPLQTKKIPKSFEIFKK